MYDHEKNINSFSHENLHITGKRRKNNDVKDFHTKHFKHIFESPNAS